MNETLELLSYSDPFEFAGAVEGTLRDEIPMNQHALAALSALKRQPEKYPDALLFAVQLRTLVDANFEGVGSTRVQGVLIVLQRGYAKVSSKWALHHGRVGVSSSCRPSRSRGSLLNVVP